MARRFPLTTEVVPANAPGVWMIRATFKRSPARLLAEVFTSRLAALDAARRLTSEGIVFKRKPVDPVWLQSVINAAAPKPVAEPKPRVLGITSQRIDRTLPNTAAKSKAAAGRGPMPGATTPTNAPAPVRKRPKLKREPNLAPHLVQIKHTYNQRLAYALQLTRRRADHLHIVRNKFIDPVRVQCDEVRKVSWRDVPSSTLHDLLDHFVATGALKKSERRAILADHRAFRSVTTTKATRRNTWDIKHPAEDARLIYKAKTTTADNARPPHNIGKGAITAEFRRANGIW